MTRPRPVTRPKASRISMDNRIALCESILNYTFTNKILCAETLQISTKHNTRGNVRWKDLPYRQEPTTRSFGDKLLGFVLCLRWYGMGMKPSMYHHFDFRSIYSGIDPQCKYTNQNHRGLQRDRREIYHVKCTRKTRKYTWDQPMYLWRGYFISRQSSR